MQAAWKAAPEIARLMAGALPPVCGGDLRLLQQLYPHIMCGYDRGGRPVRIECMGRVRVKEIYENTTPQEILDYHVWQCGQLVSRFLPAAERRTGHPTYQVTAIIDMQNAKLGTLMLKQSREHVSRVIGSQTEYFPEVRPRAPSPQAAHGVRRCRRSSALGLSPPYLTAEPRRVRQSPG